MCSIAKLLLYSSSIFDIVMINDRSTHLFVELLVYYACMLVSIKYVRWCLDIIYLRIHLILRVVW
jgi:hypothetical protein